VNVGDIHWVELPASTGREQHGRRPGIVIQEDSYSAGLPVVLVVPRFGFRAQPSLRRRRKAGFLKPWWRWCSRLERSTEIGCASELAFSVSSISIRFSRN
jgi:hypothetical protein